MLAEEGKCKAIGLSDISLEKVQEIVAAAAIKPAVVHLESHPYLPEWELLDYCRANGIVLQAFAPLGHNSEPNLLEDPVITGIASRVGKDSSPKWHLPWAHPAPGTALLTTSKNPTRIKENFDVSISGRAMRERGHLAGAVQRRGGDRRSRQNSSPGQNERRPDRTRFAQPMGAFPRQRWGVGTKTDCMPAAVAAAMPVAVSSKTRQLSGATSRRRAASRNGSGAGLPR